MAQESIQLEHQDRISDLLGEPSKTFTSHKLVTTKSAFYEFLDELEQQSIFAYDTETNGNFDRFEVALVGLSFCWNNEHAWYIPVGHFEGEQLDIAWVLEQLKPIFENPDQEKICHNAKFDEMVLSRYGIDVKGAGNCTYVCAWLLSEDIGGKGLKALVEKNFDIEMETYEDVISSAPKKKGVPRDYNFARVGLAEALSYAGDDAFYTWKLFWLFKPQLDAQQLWGAYIGVERPFVRILRKLEARGVYMNADYINEADERLPKIIEQVEAAIYEEAGEVFNIGSGKQLGHILFEKLGIGKNVPRTDKGDFSTSKETLKTYAGATIVDNVLRRKKIKKTHSVFVDGLKGFISSDGKIHPSFNGCGTVTGRLSCSNPNLQQIEGDEVEDIRVRNFFIPSPGHVFVVADYAQVEYRVMAHFSKDDAMLKAFAAGHDFHEETARLAFKVPPGEEVLHRQRFIAKSINFGIGYGRGPRSLAETLGCSLEEAQEYIANYYRTFAGLSAYKEHVVKQARKHGYVRTLSGRKRRLLPDIRSDNWQYRGRAERQAFNTKIQGSAADIIKLAMISLEPELKKHDAYMCIQIHDELVMEAPEGRAEEVLETAKRVMENPLKGKNPLILPLKVDPKIVERWGDAK